MAMGRMDVCVVGGGGFVGSHIADAFLLRGDTVDILEYLSSYRSTHGDKLSTWWDLEEVTPKPRAVMWSNDLPSNHYDLAVNCACRDLPYGIEHPFQCYKETVSALQGVLEMAEKGYYDKVLQISSSEADHPSTFYGAAKASCDLLVEAATKQLDLSIMKPYKPFNLFGPRQLAPALIPNTIKAWLVNKPVYIYGSFDIVRNFSWVEDVSKEIVAMGHGENPSDVRVWSASIKEVLESVKATSLKGSYVITKPRPGDYTIEKKYNAPDELFDAHMVRTVEWYRWWMR